MNCQSQVNRKTPHGIVPTPCGRCYACMLNRQGKWIARFWLETKRCDDAQFLTLTYNEENVPTTEGLNEQTGELGTVKTLSKKDYKNFIKQVRKADDRNRKNRPINNYIGQPWAKFKYGGIAEYGEMTLRPHYHFMIWNLHPDTLKALKQGKYWTKGNIKVDPAGIDRIKYITKHQIKAASMYDKLMLGMQKPFRTYSKHPPIGHGYLEDGTAYANHVKAKHKTIHVEGSHYAVPEYFTKKLEGETTFHRKAMKRFQIQKEQQERENKWNQRYNWPYEVNERNRMESLEREAKAMKHRRML